VDTTCRSVHETINPTGWDITERTVAEEALRRALHFTEVLLEQSPMGIRVFDGDTGINKDVFWLRAKSHLPS
jgi:PAS domain-containing protein